MTKEMKLLTAIGWVKDEYIQEMLEPCRARVPRKKIWLVAAVIATALLLTGCAAVYLMSLEGQTLHQVFTSFNDWEEPKMYTLISLQGLEGSPQFQAAQEWVEFNRTYDPDAKIIQSMPRDEMDQGEEYDSYSCYTPEMARKIDEICEKYGLQKQGRSQDYQSWENICHVLQIDGAVKEDANLKFKPILGYIYRTGTFKVDGEIEFSPDEVLSFEFYCASKKDFDTVYLNVGDPEQYEQWTFPAADGEDVLLARGLGGGLLLADRGEKFISMNLDSYGWEVSAEQLEKLAGLLDFSFRLQPLSGEDWQYLEDHKVEKLFPEIGTYVDSSYADRVKILLDGFPQAQSWGYTMMDVDGNDSLDLVIGKDGIVRMIFTTDGENTYLTPFNYYVFDLKENAFGDPPDFSMIPSYAYLCEDNKLLYVSKLTDGKTVYQIAGVVDGKLTWVDVVVEDPSQNSWYRKPADPTQPGYREDEPITKEQFDEILSSCVPIQLDMKPLTEFPLA